MKLIDLTGQVFGQLTVLRRGEWKYGKVFWICSCSCGKTAEARGSDLKNGKTRSCGCRQGGWKHGHSRTVVKHSRTHHTWDGMRQRCTNPNATGYRLYGGRGITICPRWNIFEAFLEDMGERPEGKTLDRIDNDGPYSPENCRWATRREQNLNRTHLNPAAWARSLRNRDKATGRFTPGL